MEVDISIVIPTYNAARSIREVVEKSLAAWTDKRIEIILVDDASTDGTQAVIEELKRDHAFIESIVHEKNMGQQRSLKDGMTLAKGNYVITMDDDLQQDPYDMPKLLGKLQEGYHVVYGLPVRNGYPVHRAMGSKVVDLFFTWFLKKPKDVKVGSYRIMPRWIVEKVVEDKRDFVYITAIILDHTKNMANEGVSFRERPYGTTNYNWKKLFRLFVRLFIEYGWKKGNNS